MNKININKKVIILSIVSVLLFIIMVCAIAGCVRNARDNNSATTYQMKSVSFKDRLVYDKETNIVYIQNPTGSNGEYSYTPYVSENGLFYEYINGEIREVRDVG